MDASRQRRMRQRVAITRIEAVNISMWTYLASLTIAEYRDRKLHEQVERECMARNEMQTRDFELLVKKCRTLAQEPIAPYF